MRRFQAESLSSPAEYQLDHIPNQGQESKPETDHELESGQAAVERNAPVESSTGRPGVVSLSGTHCSALSMGRQIGIDHVGHALPSRLELQR